MTADHHAGRRARPLRRAPLAQALLLASLGTAAALQPIHAQTLAPEPAAAPSRYDIPPGPLDQALNHFAVQAGVLLAIDASLTTGKTSAGLAASVTVEEGLRRLLAGTGLEAVKGERGYVLRNAASASAPAAVAAPAHAASEPRQLPEDTLPVITALGTREPGVPLSNVPASISYVGPETVQRDLATSARIEDIVARSVPGVHPSNVGSRTIRGRTAQVFVNGAPTNEQMRFGAGSDLDTLSPDHLAGVEVSRGANAAYGFGSPGGIIALTTPRADSETLSLRTRVRTSFNTSQPGGSFQTTAYQSAARIVGDFDYHVAFSANRDGTNYTPHGEVANIFTSPGLFKNGDEKIYNVDANLGYDFGTAGRIRFVTTAQNIDYVKYYNIDGGVYRGTHATATLVPESPLSWRRARTFNLSYENDDVAGHALKLELFGSRVLADRYELFDERYKQKNQYLGLRSAVTTQLPGLQKGTSVTYGVDAVRNDMADPQYSIASGQLSGLFGPAARLEMLAPYAQLDLPLGKAKLSGGVRHERYGGRVDSTGNGTVTAADDGPGGKVRDFNLTLFNLGLLYPLSERTDLQATYTQGAEVSQMRRSGFVVDSPERIDPQAARSHQYELGLRHKRDGASAAVTAFYTTSRLMSSTDCSDPTIPCVPLREPRRIWGVEFSGDWRIDAQWKLAGTLTWHDGRRKAEGSDEWSRISSIDVAPIHGSVVLDHAPRKDWRNSLVVDWRGSRSRIGDGWPEGQVDAVTLLHVTSAIDVGPGTLQLGIHNLLNTTHYSIQAEAYNGGWVWLPEQGRRVSLGYSVKW
jgi:iron complex outermembrane receptor protein